MKKSIQIYKEYKMVCVGLIGQIGVGKTTTANYLKDKYNYESYAFSAPLKKACEALGFKHHELYGTQEQKMEVNEIWGVTGRKFMQIFGTEICREKLPELLHDNQIDISHIKLEQHKQKPHKQKQHKPENEAIWVKLFNKYISENLEKNIVVEDVRFADEALAIKQNGGLLIQIYRHENPHKQSNHKSETFNGHVDIHLFNNNIDDYKKQLDSIITALHG